MSNKNKQPKKKKFEVEQGESIHSCLERIEKEGYQPIRRTEKPIFQEKGEEVEPIDRKIVFDAMLVKHER